MSPRELLSIFQLRLCSSASTCSKVALRRAAPTTSPDAASRRCSERSRSIARSELPTNNQLGGTYPTELSNTDTRLQKRGKDQQKCRSVAEDVEVSEATAAVEDVVAEGVDSSPTVLLRP